MMALSRTGAATEGETVISTPVSLAIPVVEKSLLDNTGDPINAFNVSGKRAGGLLIAKDGDNYTIVTASSDEATGLWITTGATASATYSTPSTAAPSGLGFTDTLIAVDPSGLAVTSSVVSEDKQTVTFSTTIESIQMVQLGTLEGTEGSFVIDVPSDKVFLGISLFGKDDSGDSVESQMIAAFSGNLGLGATHTALIKTSDTLASVSFDPLNDEPTIQATPAIPSGVTELRVDVFSNVATFYADGQLLHTMSVTPGTGGTYLPGVVAIQDDTTISISPNSTWPAA